MTTLAIATPKRSRQKSRVVVLGASSSGRGSIAAYNDLLCRALHAEGFAIHHGFPQQEPPDPERCEVCFDSREFTSKAEVAAMLARKAASRFNWVKVLHNGGLPHRFRDFSPRRQAAVRESIEAADHLVAVNDLLRDWLVKDLRLDRPVQCISGLLPIPPGYAARSLPDSLADFCDRHEKVLCVTGVFMPEFGFDQAADAVEQIRRADRRNLGLVLLNCNCRGNARFRGDVIGNKEWIHVADRMPHRQLLLLLKRCDVVLRCARREDRGLARIEAIRLGTPVVATRVAGETRGMLLYDFGCRHQIVSRIREALEGGKGANGLLQWAAFFTRLAEANLAELSAIARQSPKPA